MDSTRAPARRRLSAEPKASGDGPLLIARGLSKRFGAVAALEGVDLDVRAGEVLAVDLREDDEQVCESRI